MDQIIQYVDLRRQRSQISHVSCGGFMTVIMKRKYKTHYSENKSEQITQRTLVPI